MRKKEERTDENLISYIKIKMKGTGCNQTINVWKKEFTIGIWSPMEFTHEKMIKGLLRSFLERWKLT